MRLTTPGKLLLEEAIPDEYLPKGKALTEKVIKGIFTEIARKEPERYSDIMGKLTDVSKEAVYRYGRMASIGLKDLEIPPELARYREKVRQDVDKIIESDSLTGAEKNKAIVQYLYKKMSEIPEKVVEAAKNMNSGFYAQVESGARGNKNQLMQVIFGDTLLIDAEDRPVPIPVLHSYGEGVKPMEYWAASSGARKGSISVQFSTADGGYLGKQLNNIGHRLVVTDRDCGTKNGIPVDANDEDNIGSVLAMPVGKIPAGTVITPEILPKLGDGKIRVRSLATCALGDGVCAICSGIRERGDFPAIGDTVGIVGARAMSEPITQAGLKCLHPDTLVRMADWSIKPLKDIVVGDIVLGADIKGNCFPSKVINVFDNGIQPMYTTEYKAGLPIENTVSIVSTLEHKLLQVTSNYSSLELLPAGFKHDNLFAAILSSADNVPYLAARDTQIFFGNTQALDIEVDNADHLFVLANGLIVSNSKHSGGVAGTDDKNVSGFEELNQFIQVPSTFKGAATLSEIDGTVLGVKEAPAGGQFVFVNDKRFYVPRGREVIVKKGDSVTAGDMLSDGTPNPAELVKYKGVGEGRRYFIDKYRELLKKNGAAVHRRNIEAVARGFINRVKMDSPDGYNGYMIDDIVPYDELAVDYEPRAGSKLLGPNQAKNMYLEQPVLHYTIGTRITPQVIKDLNSNKISNIVVNEQQPVFSPFVVRARSIMETDPDWMTRMAGENLKRSTLEAARMGAKSTTEGTSYFPAAANPVGLDTYKGGTPDRSLHKTFTQVR